MGWKGQGLGKYEQGIITPLVAKRTSDKYGIIINANVSKEERILNIISFYNRTPTKILLLTNISDSVTLDDEVLLEFKEECQQFGNLAVTKINKEHQSLYISKHRSPNSRKNSNFFRI